MEWSNPGSTLISSHPTSDDGGTDTEEVLAIAEEPDQVDELTRTLGDAEARVVITKPEEIAPGFDSVRRRSLQQHDRPCS